MEEHYMINPTISYDVVELPSKGIYYENKRKSLKVGYLTASDENILSAPNLIQSNTVVDELLKRKVLDKDFKTEDLAEEDRQAILIFLRNTAFGTTYKFKSTDPKTGQKIVDVSPLTIPVSYYNNPERQNITPWIGWDKLSRTFSVELNYPITLVRTY